MELSYHPDVVSGLYGQSQIVLVQVQNRLAEPIQGQLDLKIDTSDGTDAAAKPDWQPHPFTVEPESFTGVPLTLKPPQLDSGNVHIRAVFEHKGQSIQTSPATLPYLVRTIDWWCCSGRECAGSGGSASLGGE